VGEGRGGHHGARFATCRWNARQARGVTLLVVAEEAVNVGVHQNATTTMPPYSNAAVDDAAINVVGLTSPAAASLISTTPTLATGPSSIPCSLAIERDACVIVGFLLRGIGRPNTSGRIDVLVRICEHGGTAIRCGHGMSERARLDEMTNLRLVQHGTTSRPVGGMGHPRGGTGGRGVDNVGRHAKRRRDTINNLLGRRHCGHISHHQ
jgi:hypothetical protein